MSRRIAKLPDHVYFVIGKHSKYDGTYDTVDGPYSTLAAAKGKRTSFRSYIYDPVKRAEQLAKYIIVESPAGEWKPVEL